jgi:hypothetical protein
MVEANLAIKVDVYGDEFIPLLKVINTALAMPDKFALTPKEQLVIETFKDDFAILALEYGS